MTNERNGQPYSDHIFDLISDRSIFTENEGSFLPTKILAKQENVFWKTLLNYKYGINGSPKNILVQV